MTRARFALFATAAVLLSLGSCAAALLAADLYAHHRFERAAGVNIWGYRGPVVGRKSPHEIRIAAVGGSTVLNYGLSFEASFPHQLETLLNASSAAAGRRFSVVNLGYNNAGAYSFQYTLADYEYLHYDLAVLYEGYNDLSSKPNRRVTRRDSAVFRWTGYYPLLPIVVGEKAMQLRSGDIHEAYRGRVVFRPSAVARTKAALLEASARILQSLDTSTAGDSADGSAPADAFDACTPRWAAYCRSVAEGVDAARSRHSAVLVVTQPYANAVHRAQQDDLRRMLAHRYGANPLVMYVNLGDAVDVTDPALCWDGMHLMDAGNARIAAGIAPAVLEMIGRPTFAQR